MAQPKTLSDKDTKNEVLELCVCISTRTLVRYSIDVLPEILDMSVSGVRDT